ncbi:MAG: B3/4 domain-containing protein [Nitrososphaerota archaeon]
MRASDACAALLHAAAASCASSFARSEHADIADIATHPAIAPWRDAYRRFGVKPSKYRSSVESLVRSALAQSVHTVNPLVDLYNAVSLAHLLPCGGEDLDATQGDIFLTRADGGEQFTPLGTTQEQPARAGEVIYRDALGALCRCWNWREAERTKLTSVTRNAFLCIEALQPMTERHVRAACEELASHIRTTLGGVASIHVLGSDTLDIQIYAQ